MESFNKVFLIIFVVLFMQSCGQPAGNAPGITTDSPATGLYEVSVTNGESQITSNGWTIGVDTTDPVQRVTLANGWTVEDAHE